MLGMKPRFLFLVRRSILVRVRGSTYLTTHLSYGRSFSGLFMRSSVIDTQASTTTHRLFQIALGLFAGAIAFSFLGILLLTFIPSSMELFAPYMNSLIQAPTWTYMTLLGLIPLLMYGPVLGARRMSIIVVWGCVIGGGSELIGTTGWLSGLLGLSWSFPFGDYTYTGWLGPEFAGHVPYFIPASWFAMALISLDLARRIPTGRGARVLIATVFMVLWDVSLDPAMNGAGSAAGTVPFWRYAVDGFYYGMPLSNWFGWFLVSYIIIWGYEAFAGGLDTVHTYAPIVYALNCLFPLLILLVQGLYIPLLIGIVATLVPFAALARYSTLPLWPSTPALRRPPLSADPLG